jgi:predicted enzyme related to lactoylglutathione lyase
VVKQLAMASVKVKDWQGAVVWYQEKLGLTPSNLHDDPFCLMKFPEGEAVIALDGTGQADGAPGNWQPVVQVDDLVATVAELKRRGVQFSSELKASDEGFRTAVILDLEGNHIELFDYVQGVNEATSG